MNKSYRIAFLTPEFVTERPDRGGLGNYHYRLAKLLALAGHQPEIFTPSQLRPRIFLHDGIRVERVVPLGERLKRIGPTVAWFAQSLALAGVMERRHRQQPFDFVQSASYQAAGLTVRRRTGRVHLVRCASAADLCNEAEGHPRPTAEKLERAGIRRADKAYAPSLFLARHFRERHGMEMEVLRPPAWLEMAPAADSPCALPDRFLVHVGQLKRGKGTLWLAASLKIVFESEPSFRMVWVGPVYDGEVEPALAALGEHRSKVEILNPLPRPQLYAIVQRALATVLPSLVDNLPNAGIESLLLGIPIVGTRGASINELVEEGVTGELVPANDVGGLARVMLKVWRGESPARKGFVWTRGIAAEMQPERAIDGLFRLAGLSLVDSHAV